MEDLDLNLQDFVARVNSDLLGKYINIASRSAGFLVKRFGGVMSDEAMNNPLLKEITASSEKIAELYEGREYAKALRTIMELADMVNGFVDENKPWDIAKDPEREADLQRVCSVTLEAFRMLSLYLKPVIPQVATGVEEFLSLPPQSWSDINTPLSSKNPIKAYKHLMTRVEAPQIEALLAANL
jgi:methionyl-tRNA synthetase